MLWIVDQTILGLLESWRRLEKWIVLFRFHRRDFNETTRAFSILRVYLYTTMLLAMYIKLTMSFVRVKCWQVNRMSAIKSRIQSEIYGQLWGWNYMKVVHNMKTKLISWTQLKAQCRKLSLPKSRLLTVFEKRGRYINRQMLYHMYLSIV